MIKGKEKVTCLLFLDSLAYTLCSGISLQFDERKESREINKAQGFLIALLEVLSVLINVFLHYQW